MRIWCLSGSMVHVYRIAHRSVSSDAFEGSHKFGQVEEAPLPVQQLASHLRAFLSARLSKTGGHQALTVLQRAMSEFESGPSVPTSGVHFAPWQTTVAVARQLVAGAVAR